MTVLDLFAGPGGWDVAARRIGIDPIGLEWDDAACATREAAGFRTDQCDVGAVELTETTGWIGLPVKGIIASPPCQAFSSAGKGKGRDDLPKIRRCAIQLRHGRDTRADYEWSDERAPLVLEPLRWVLALRPTWTCWEQVPPVLPFWELCAKLLASQGYSVWTGNLHAEQYGVPQTRKRAVLIASRVGPVGPPAPTHSRYYPRDKGKLDLGVEKWVSMAEALGWEHGGMVGFPRLADGNGETVELDGKQYRARDFRSTDEPAFNLTEKARSWQVRFGNQANSAVRRADEPAATIRFSERMNACDWELVANDRLANSARRNGEEPAPTITAGNDYGNRKWMLTRQVGAQSRPAECPSPTVTSVGLSSGQQVWTDRGGPYVAFEERATQRVTVQEAAVLQSFPADFPWQGSRTKQFEQVGNAIPPGLALPVLVAAGAAGAQAQAWAT